MHIVNTHLFSYYVLAVLKVRAMPFINYYDKVSFIGLNQIAKQFDRPKT